jgi:hypothetical protein
MIGLFFFATLALWLVTCPWLAIKIGNRVPNPRWRFPVKLAILFALLSAPFVDEVIGMQQFNALCKANGIESADLSKARGRKVKVGYSKRRPVGGTLVPIQESAVWFRDAESGEIVIEHMNYYARGGWLMRYTWLGMGHGTPMLFSGSTCDLRKEQELFKRNQIVLLYK